MSHCHLYIVHFHMLQQTVVCRWYCCHHTFCSSLLASNHQCLPGIGDSIVMCILCVDLYLQHQHTCRQVQWCQCTSLVDSMESDHNNHPRILFVQFFFGEYDQDNHILTNHLHPKNTGGKAVLVKASARLDFFFDDSIRKWLRHVLQSRDTRLQIRSKRLRLLPKPEEQVLLVCRRLQLASFSSVFSPPHEFCGASSYPLSVTLPAIGSRRAHAACISMLSATLYSVRRG